MREVKGRGNSRKGVDEGDEGGGVIRRCEGWGMGLSQQKR